MSESYLVCAVHAWNRRIYEEEIRSLPGRWRFVSTPGDLEMALQVEVPRLVFFLHWSQIVPDYVLRAAECVGFHMADLPHGRGGSPLQHEILEGRAHTTLTAFRMTDELDAGPVYCRADLCLAGAAEEVYRRASRVAAGMVRRIAGQRIEPVPQGEPMEAPRRRRTPAQSQMVAPVDLDAVYDHVRMLDAAGYPHAYVIHDGYRYTFRRAVRYDGRVEADVAITVEEGGGA